ncbi:uncharacterized protein LOC122640329 [Telopea speciosissima]|uniref:uncharacterized protein LOC122640329 n=1 Tax=Telopea speciosissima TaxID=54955 RepID=UPI001CC54F9E|nr:uncharacterized protein LOC122640329 [Telopea speciosissima]
MSSALCDHSISRQKKAKILAFFFMITPSPGGRLSRSRLKLLTRIDKTFWNIDDGDNKKMQKVDGGKRSLKKLIEEETSNRQHQKQHVRNAAVEQIRSDPRNGSQLEKKQNVHNLFKKKIKFQNRSPSNGHESPQVLNRIVILQPEPTETSPSSSLQSHYNLKKKRGSMRMTSNFSPTEIKRKLKLVMQESRNEKHLMQGVLHEHPWSEDSGSMTRRRDFSREPYFWNEKNTKLSSNVKRHRIGKPKDCQPIIGQKDAPTSVKVQKIIKMTNTDNYKRGKSKVRIRIEAERHLADMIRTRNDVSNLLSRQIPQTLWMILSLPEYNLSPTSSPGSERERRHSFLSAQMRYEPYDSLWKMSENMWQPKQEFTCSKPSPPMQNINSPMCINENNPENRLQFSDSNSDLWKEFLLDAELQGSTSSYKPESSTKADVKVAEKTGIQCPEENDLLNESSEPNSRMVITATDQGVDKIKICEDKGSSECLRLVNTVSKEDLQYHLSNQLLRCSIHIYSQEENQPSSFCLCPFVLRSLLNQKIEDQVGTGNKTEQPSPVEPFTLGKVISNGITGFQPVLQTSGLSWDKLLVRSRWHSSDQLLDTSFIDEVKILSGQLSDDRQLLLDCTDEVLLEAYNCSFGCSPWASFLKPIIRSLPVEENFIREVREGIDWHLLPQRPHHTLDQIVRKDMRKANKWMDPKSNIETIGNEMGDTILGELIEDIMYQMCA